jgi:hypothetical protein
MDILGPLWNRIEDKPALYAGLVGFGVLVLTWSSRRSQVRIWSSYTASFVLSVRIRADFLSLQPLAPQLDVPTYGGIYSFSRILAFLKVNREGSKPWMEAYLNVRALPYSSSCLPAPTGEVGRVP